MWQLKHHVNRNNSILGYNMPGILCLCHQEFQPLQGSWNTVYKTKFPFRVIQFSQWKASWHSILGESSAVSEWKIFWNFYFWKTNCCRKWPWHSQVNCKLWKHPTGFFEKERSTELGSSGCVLFIMKLNKIPYHNILFLFNLSNQTRLYVW